MSEQHPITPPPELFEQWEAETAHTTKDESWHVAVQAARWGADQELEACCKWLMTVNPVAGIRQAERLRKTRRPDPSSLKGQALGALGRFNANAHTRADEMVRDFDTIRRALEQLDG